MKKEFNEPETIDFKINPGQRLREAREKALLSVAEVAKQLNLTSRIIEDIEKNDFSNTKFVFLRGYLRAYAKKLNLPADEIISAFNDLNVDECENNDRARWHFNEQGLTIKDKPVRWVTYLIAFSLVVLVMLWWHSQRRLPSLNDNPILSEKVTPAKTAAKKVKVAESVKAKQPTRDEPLASEKTVAKKKVAQPVAKKKTEKATNTVEIKKTEEQELFTNLEMPDESVEVEKKVETKKVVRKKSEPRKRVMTDKEKERLKHQRLRRRRGWSINTRHRSMATVAYQHKKTDDFGFTMDMDRA